MIQLQENNHELQLPPRELILRQWESLICDTTGDELSEGGQSLRELERLEQFEEFLSTLEQVEIPTFHHFATGVYVREMHAPRDAVIIGHEHQHDCINICSQGRVLTIVNGQVQEFVAPCNLRSGAHTRKASIVVEDLIWNTCHPNPDNCRNIMELEERYLIKSPTFLRLTA